MRPLLRMVFRLLALWLLALLSLQLFFVLRVAAMAVIDPQSTAFQRSEAWRIATATRALPWHESWIDGSRISNQLKRAVIASEDAGFVEHKGIEWDAVEKAWGKNQRAESRAERANGRSAIASSRAGAPSRRDPKVVGGSTITQQLAKNLFLSGERTLPRKAEEVVITYALELALSKRRILEIYLNHVEWGEGVFGAEAAAQHYFHIGADQLGAQQSARLAVMLPAPKRFERNPSSGYVVGRAATVVARMGSVALP